MKNLILNIKIQKIVLWLFLLAAAAVIVGGLIYSTNFCYYSTKQATNGSITKMFLADGEKFPDLYKIWGEPRSAGETQLINGYKEFTEAFESTNTYIFISGVVCVAIFAIMCIFGNKYRKKYYLSNLIVGIVGGIISITLMVVGIILNINTIGKFNDNKPLLEFISAYRDVAQNYGVNANYCYATMVIQIIAVAIFVIFIIFTVLKYFASKSNTIETESSLEEVTE